MGLFPTFDNLQDVINMATSMKSPTPNNVLAILRIYHNTLLKALEKQQ